MKKTSIAFVLLWVVISASWAQQPAANTLPSLPEINLRGGLQVSLRGGYDVLPMYPKLTDKVKFTGGLMGGLSADYYWNWVGAGVDVDYIQNGITHSYTEPRAQSVEFTKKNVTRLFYGIGPDFRYLTPDNKISAELNLRGGLASIQGGSAVVNAVYSPTNSQKLFSFDGFNTNVAPSFKAQLRFTYFFNQNWGVNAGGYYMTHFNVPYNEPYEYKPVVIKSPPAPKSEINGTPPRSLAPAAADMIITPNPVVSAKGNISSVGVFAGVTFRLPVVIKPPVPKAPKQPKVEEDFIVQGKVVICKTDKPIEGVTITIKNKQTGAEQILKSDAKGEFTFTMKPKSELIIYGKKANYFSQMVTIRKNDYKNQQSKYVKLVICMEKIDCNTAIRLDNIHYDLDKYDIRPDAKPELDRLVQFLKDNPEVRVELSSHTNSRASNEYNQKLSQNRANAARAYVISQGISPSRIVSVGYGESRLLNKCADGVPCSEEEHQLNRRTEMKVICPE